MGNPDFLVIELPIVLPIVRPRITFSVLHQNYCFAMAMAKFNVRMLSGELQNFNVDPDRTGPGWLQCYSARGVNNRIYGLHKGITGPIDSTRE